MEPLRTTSDYKWGVLRVRCPNCGEVARFPVFDNVERFVCAVCGLAVTVEGNSTDK